MMDPNKLALMAENICENCASSSQEQQAEKTITHMRTFWSEAMCKDLVQAFEHNQVELSPALQQVVRQLLD